MTEKTGFVFFFTQKLIFNLFLTKKKNTLETLLNQSMTPKNTKKKKTSKPKINPKPKIFLSYDLFFRHFQGKKKKLIVRTPLIIWNHLAQKFTVLVIKIIVNINFLSLHGNLVSPSLSYHPKFNFWTLKGLATLEPKKMGGKNEFLRQIFKAAYFTRFFHFSPLSFNSTLSPKTNPIEC